jgi:hypothetical protein
MRLLLSVASMMVAGTSQIGAQPLDAVSIEVSHILVADQTQIVRALDRIRAQSSPADRLATFRAIARAESLDPGSRDVGGYLGKAVASTYVPIFARVALNLEPGEVSPPVATPFGWHLIYLHSKGPAPTGESLARDGVSRLDAKWKYFAVTDSAAFFIHEERGRRGELRTAWVLYSNVTALRATTSERYYKSEKTLFVADCRGKRIASDQLVRFLTEWGEGEIVEQLSPSSEPRLREPSPDSVGAAILRNMCSGESTSRR